MKKGKDLAQSFLNSPREIFFVFEKDGAVSYVNETVTCVLGYAPEDIIGRKISEFTHRDDLKIIKKEFESAIDGDSQMFDSRIKPNKGTSKWLSWSLFTVDGDLCAIAHDVTNTRSDQETLRRAQVRLRLLHQATSSPTQTLGEKIERVLDLGNRQLDTELAMISSIKGEMYSVIRFKSSGITVDKADNYYLKKDGNNIGAQTETLTGVQDMQNVLYSGVSKNEEIKFASHIAVPLYMGRDLYGVLSFSRKASRENKFDVADYDFMRVVGDWVSSSLALLFANESIAYNAAIVASSKDAIIGQRADGNISLWNKGAEKLFLYTQNEIIGKHYSVLVPNDIKKETEEVFDKLLEGQEVGHFDTIRMKKDGSTFDISLTFSPIVNEDNEIIGASSVARDITQEKLVDRAKTEFVSLASHQLRTPLSAINWYAELLSDGSGGKLNKKQKKFVDEIFAGNKRMVRLVNRLLNVSRIDFGSFTIAPEDIDIVDVSRSVIKEMAPKISKKKLVVRQEYVQKKFVYNADPNIFRIILQNLVSNAVKYTRNGGTIVVKINKDAKKNKLLIEVEDNGYGIPKDQQGNIFSKLFRADNAKEMDTEGTGLGLYILKSITEEAGGSIRFESTEGEGTTFFVNLPLSGMKKKEGTKTLA